MYTRGPIWSRVLTVSCERHAGQAGPLLLG
jgi:hypothetical protein